MSDRAHDREFERWYRLEHGRVLAALAVAGGDADIAREATDEAFVRAYEKWSTVRRMASPGGWLYRVALNDLRRRFRRRAIERRMLGRRSRFAGPAGAEAPPVADPVVWRAVSRLPERQRTAVALRYVLDLTEKEVGHAMNISRGAASATLNSARRNLEEALGEPIAERGDDRLPKPAVRAPTACIPATSSRMRADDG